MKKFIIPLLTIAILAGCSKGANTDIGAPDDQVPILLNSGVLLTKAAIVEGVTFTANVAGWESASVVDYIVGPNWISTASVEASQTSKGVTLVSPRYYNPDAATKTYMKAWFPSGTVAAGQVTFASNDYKTDGTMDVLLAPQIVGDKGNTTGKILAFTHLLSQVSFKVVADASMTTTPTLTSITIRNAELPTGINLVTDALLCSAAADLATPGIVAGVTTIDATAKTAGSPVMFKPFAGNTFAISVTTSEITYADAMVTIKDDAAFVPGKSYDITVTFKAKNEITLSATVAPWQTGSGSVTVE